VSVPAVPGAAWAVRAGGGDETAPAVGRDRLAALAAEFEAMLLTQMLRDMRRAGSWAEESGGDGLGADAFFETLDVELARHLAAAQGFGLAREMVQAWTHRHGRAVSPVAETTGQDAVLAPAAGVAARPDGVRVSSPFGWRTDPLDGVGRFHHGVDLRAAYGQDVRTAAPGTVVFSGEQGSYGVTVVVQHADGVQSRYAHLSAVLVQAGDPIGAGAIVGRVGQTGRATGPHLHVEVTSGGRRVDPVASGLNLGAVLADSTHERTAAFEEQGHGRED
jgi:murein DD-endopeptidase MepM/ murein hydrolase activator NlpD